jgi:site-specific recombinase XerD
MEANKMTAAGSNWKKSFGDWLVEEGKASLTVEAYLQDVHHLELWCAKCGQEFSPEKLTKAIVREYLAWQKTSKAAVASRNRRLATLRVLAGWARGMGLISADPVASFHRERFERTPRAKDETEWQGILTVLSCGGQLKASTARQGWLGKRDRLIIGLLGVGLRVAEVVAMDIDDVHVDEIHVRGKGGIERDLYVSEQLASELAAWGQGKTGALIVDAQGRRLTTGQVRRRVESVGLAAGMKLKPHDLRHTRVYRLLDFYLNQGLNIPTAVDAVRQDMGHADSRTTMMYLRARDSQKREAARAL